MRYLSLLLLNFILLYPSLTLASLLVPSPPPIAARAYILQDFYSGKVLMAKKADERLEPASLTKLMTAYLVFQKLKIGKIKLTEPVKISQKAWKMGGSRMYLDPGTFVPVDLLLKGMIIQSGNDASVALAELIGGTEQAFATLMNEQAQRLGLKNTHYVNSTGLPDEQHYSTARDSATIAQALIYDFPSYYRWYSGSEFTYNNITQTNRNRLLRRKPPLKGMKVDGMKTGYTDAAGYCLVASAIRKNMRLISVVLGTKNEKARTEVSERMLDYGFRFFRTYPLYQVRQVLDIQRVWHGNTAQLPLGLSRSLYITVPKGQYGQLNATAHIDKYIMAPVMAGKSYGSLKIRLGNQIILERPLVALSSIDKGPFWKRLIDSFFKIFY